MNVHWLGDTVQESDMVAAKCACRPERTPSILWSGALGSGGDLGGAQELLRPQKTDVRLWHPHPIVRNQGTPGFSQRVSAFPFLELLESTLRGTRALDCSASLEGAAEVPAQRSPPGGAGRQEQ